MTRYTLLGGLACVGGGLLLGFQKIAVYMGIEANWKALSIADVVGPKAFAGVADALPSRLETAVGYLAAMPLYVLLFCIGALILVLGQFLGRR